MESGLHVTVIRKPARPPKINGDFSLPPIEMSGRMKKCQPLPITYQGHTQHWEAYGKPLPISYNNEHRVVSHLKHRFNNRSGKRTDTSTSGGDSGVRSSDPGTSDSFPNERSQTSTASRDIFSRYSDVGGCLYGESPDGLGSMIRPAIGPAAPRPFDSPESSEMTPKPLEPIGSAEHCFDNQMQEQAAQRLKELTTISEGDVILKEENQNWGNKDLKRKKRDDKVQRTREEAKSAEKEKKAEKTEKPANGRKMENEVEPPPNAEKSEKDAQKAAEEAEGETFDDNGPEFEMPEDTRFGPASFRELVVSPVATPGPSRPKTRERTQNVLSQTLSTSAAPRSATEPGGEAPKSLIKIYVASAITDSDVERTALVERVYPRLREMCYQRGFDLFLHDLHWGSRDIIANDHRDAEICLSALQGCLEEEGHVKFVAFVGDKYGSLQLPVEISKDEFDALWKAISDDQAKLAQLLEEKRLKEEEERMREENQMNDLVELPEDDGEKPLGKRPSFKAVAMSEKQEKAEEKTGNEEMSRRFSKNNKKKDEQPSRQTTRKFSLLARTLGRSMMNMKSKVDVTMETLQEHDPSLIQQWYRLDENQQPPVYRLQSIGSQIKDFLRNDANKKQQAKSVWIQTAQRLQATLQYYAKKVFSETEQRRKFSISLYEQEMEFGFLQAEHSQDKKSPLSHLVLFRTMEGLRDNLSDDKAGDYIDLIAMKPEVDLDKFHDLTTLKMKLGERLSSRNHIRYEVPWHADGVAPHRTRNHVAYVNGVCYDVEEKLTGNLECEMNAKQMRGMAHSEVEYHLRTCRRRAPYLTGHKPLLCEIKTYLRSTCRYPLVIYGRVGCGKTTLASKSVIESSRWLRRSEAEVHQMVRLVGATGESLNVRTLLRSICRELAELMEEDLNEVPQGYDSLANDFNVRLGRFPKDLTLLIFIDALDQLTDDYNGRSCAWLPKDLPPNVRLVVTTAVDDRFDAFPALKKIYGEKAVGQTFMEMKELDRSEATIIVNKSFHKAGRRLTDEQFECLLQAVFGCPLPLYIEVAVRESLKWTSDLQNFKLMPSISQLIAVFFAGLEKDFGEPLVRRALGYFTAARHGLTDNEMEDILSLDEAVMDDLNAQLQLRLRRCPTMSWYRLRCQLAPYIVWRPADGISVLAWSHRAFSEAATERYLNQRDKAPSYHKILAEYFDGDWAGKPKPHMGNDKGSERYVLRQPLVFDGAEETFNLRKLSELPTHYLKSQQFSSLKSRCLCNFDWLFTKLSGLSLADVLDDVISAMKSEAEDNDARTMNNVLRLSATEVMDEPRALATQLLGRLTTLVRSDKPAAPKDPLIYPALHPLYFQARRNDCTPTLVPSQSCMTSPEAAFYDVMTGHHNHLTAIALTRDGSRAVTSSLDDTTKIWELRNGRVIAVIQPLGHDVLSLRFASNDQLLISGELRSIRVWNVKTQKCLLVIDHESDDPALVCTAGDGQYLVAFYDGIADMRTWNLKTMLPVCRKRLPQLGLHQDKTIVAAPASATEKILYGVRGTNYARVLSVRSGKTVLSPELRETGSLITAVNCTSEYLLVGCRVMCENGTEVYYIEVFDEGTAAHVRRIKGCAQDHVSEILVTTSGSHALTINCSSDRNSSDFGVWNIETEEHKHYARHAKLTTMGAMSDLRCVLTGSPNEADLCLWNMQKLVQQSSGGPTEVPAPVESIYVLPSNDKYVLAKCGASLLIWNLVRKKFTGQIVRRDKSIFSDKDTVLFNHDQLIILSDNRYSAVVPEARSVYQSAVAYDIMSKSFSNKLKDIFILPTPVDEMAVLPEQRLLGLSENRGHFVLWSLQTGQVVKRMRSNFRDVPAPSLIGAVGGAGEGILGESTNPRFIHQSSRAVPSTPMTSWDRRNESQTARRRRDEHHAWKQQLRVENLRKERDNAVDRYLMSADRTRLVAAYYAHHMCVFDLVEYSHVSTLSNEAALMHLYVAALTRSGHLMVHTNYDENLQASCVTLWDTNQGQMRKRIRNEKAVCALAISDSGHRIVIGKKSGELRVWNPYESRSLRRLPLCKGLHFEPGQPSEIRLIRGGKQAVVFAGGLSIWDLDAGQLLSIFNSDLQIQNFDIAFDGQLIVFSVKDSPNIFSLKLMSKSSTKLPRTREDLFGEEVHDSTDTENEDEPQPGSEAN